MKLLYSSNEIAKQIRQIFQPHVKSDRRVVLVAYVGKDWAEFLPKDLNDIELICNPAPGATRSEAVAEILDAGAQVKFSDRLHMKVYWSKKSGCVLGSANLSKNGLGIRGLKEAAVFLPSNQVDIDRLIKECEPYKVTKKNLDALRENERKVDAAMAKIGRRLSNDQFNFEQWLDLPDSQKRSWKLGWWDSVGSNAQSVIDKLNLEYGVSSPNNVAIVAKNQARVHDWFLSFKISARGVSEIKWLYVDFIVATDERDPAYNATYPFTAVQVFRLSRCPEPPFTLTPRFRKAFAQAVRAVGHAEVQGIRSLNPPKALLKAIQERMTHSRR